MLNHFFSYAARRTLRIAEFATPIVTSSIQRPTFPAALEIPVGTWENRELGQLEGSPLTYDPDYAIGSGAYYFVSSSTQWNSAMVAISSTTTHDVIVLTSDIEITPVYSIKLRPNSESLCDIISDSVYSGTFISNGVRVTPTTSGFRTITRALDWDGNLPFPSTSVIDGAALFDTGRNSSIYSDRASGYRWKGIRFRPHPSENRISGYFMFVGGLEATQNSSSEIPKKWTFDQCIFDGGTTQNKGGLCFSGEDSCIQNSWFQHWWAPAVDRLANSASLHATASVRFTWADVNALLCANTPGKLLIRNNYIDGTGENLMFGGAGSHAGDQTDVFAYNNHFKKDRTFYASMSTLYPSGTEGDIICKNLLETKQLLRGAFERNVLENSYDISGGGQAGVAFVPKMQSYASPQHNPQSGHILFRGNLIYQFDKGITYNGFDSSSDSSMIDIMKPIVFIDNVWHTWRDASPFTGPIFTSPNTPLTLFHFEHNTIFRSSSLSSAQIMLFDSEMTGTIFVGSVSGNIPKVIETFSWDRNVMSWGEWSSNGGISKGGGPAGNNAVSSSCFTWSLSENTFMRGISGTPANYHSSSEFYSGWGSIYESSSLSGNIFIPTASWAGATSSDGWPRGISDYAHFISQLIGVVSGS